MATARSGGKGFALEEVLKSYFCRAGYFVVRGVPYRVDGEDVTDIDLWLYERPGASTRRRIVVDAKSRKSPKAAERIIWTRGLQIALSVDTGIVATTDRRPGTRRLAKAMNVVLLDGDATRKLVQSEELKRPDQIQFEAISSALKTVDKARRSNVWWTTFRDARASLATGFGVQSANRNLKASGFFAEQALLAQPGSDATQLAIRLVYLTSSLVAVSLDFVLADHAFRPLEERRQVVIEGLRFGQSDTTQAVATVRTAIGLARQYAENGPAVAKQIEYGFFADAEDIPAEIIADYVVKFSGRDMLFNTARELEQAAFWKQLPSFDQLATDVKSFLGVLFDFNGISREKFAAAWPQHLAAASREAAPAADKAGSVGPLFSRSREA